MTPTIRNLITKDADLGKIREQAYKDGMKSLRISGAMKINIGVTTLEEVLKVAPAASGVS
jgi:general secretion pathway protein E